MNCDILLNLAIEKIRIDFGDLIASLFRIISVNNNCFLSQLIFLLSHVSYRSIRVSVIVLFQYNLIAIEDYKCIHMEEIQSIKFSTVLSEAIYRIRYPRFIALIEYDYGFYGGAILRSLLYYGQLYISIISKHSLFHSSKILKRVEDILIHMARDSLIVRSTFTPNSNFLSVSLVDKMSKNPLISKPLFKSKSSSWKVLTTRFNFRLKLNILFSLLQEYQNFQIKHVIKFYMSRLLSTNIIFTYETWISIDGISDFCKDGLIHLILNDKFIVSSIENLCFIDQSISLQEFFFKVNLKEIEFFFREKLIENLIVNQFGKKFGVIFNLLSGKKIYEEKEILVKSGLNRIQTKTILYHMHRLSFIFLEDYQVDPMIPKNTRFWKIDFTTICKKFTNNTIKCLYNLLIRLENYYTIVKKLQESINQPFFNSKSKKISRFFYRIKTLLTGIIKLDEILNVLYF